MCKSFWITQTQLHYTQSLEQVLLSFLTAFLKLSSSTTRVSSCVCENDCYLQLAVFCADFINFTLNVFFLALSWQEFPVLFPNKFKPLRPNSVVKHRCFASKGTVIKWYREFEYIKLLTFCWMFLANSFNATPTSLWSNCALLSYLGRPT